ncbi:MAG: hypothetical protein KGJ84_00480 [Elusimicrobia bacterium]|nr:hypothetical protein [Elusimicrobiota bacterium]
MRIVLYLLLVAGPAAAAAPAASTATARGRPAPLENPWSLNYGLDRRGQRYGLDYRVRWDVRDLFDSPRAARENFTNPADTVQSVAYGLLKGARLDIYGVRVRPFRETAPAPFVQSATESSSATATALAAAPPASRRLKLSLDPVGDLRRNGPREIQGFLLREGFNLALPQNRSVPGWQKEAFGRGVLDAGRAMSDDSSDP